MSILAAYVKHLCLLQEHSEQSVEVENYRGEIERLAELNKTAQTAGCESADANSIDWFEAALRIQETANPFFFGFVAKFRKAEALIEQAKNLKKSIKKCRTVALKELLIKAEAVKALVSKKQLKPTQVSDECLRLKAAYEEATAALNRHRQFQEHFTSTCDRLIGRIKEDSRTDLPPWCKKELVLLEVGPQELLDTCVTSFQAQTWNAFCSLKSLNEEWARAPKELASFASIYNSMASKAETFQPLTAPLVSLPKEPSYFPKVNWKGVALKIHTGSLKLLRGAQIKLDEVETAIDAANQELSTASGRLTDLTHLNGRIVARIENNEDVPDDARLEVFYDDYKALESANVDFVRDFQEKQIRFNRFFAFDSSKNNELIPHLDRYGFKLSGHPDNVILQIDILFGKFTQLRANDLAAWSPENALEKTIRWNFDRLAWTLEGGWDPEWIIVEQIYFKAWRAQWGYIQRDKADLPDDE